jgi:hypothetical protein
VSPPLLALALLALAQPALAQPAGGPAGDVQLHAEAGIGGIAKAHRWTPVRVVIEHSGRRFDGELVVTWGDATLRRPIVLASPGSRTFELYLRTAEAEGAVQVRLTGNPDDAASGAPGDADPDAVEARVRVLRPDEAVVLCIVPPLSAVEAGGCSAAIVADAAPASARGYEAVDEVRWPGGPVRLSAEQQDAFDVWSTLRQLDEAGDLGLTPQPARPTTPPGLPAATRRVILGLAGLYLACLTALGVVSTRRSPNAGPVFGALVLVTLAGTSATAAIGRAGPARAVHLHHSSLVQQVPGTTRSLVTIRGVAEFPAFDDFTVELPLADSMLEAAAATGRAEQRTTESGHPVLAGRFGLGARQALTVEGIVDWQPLAVDAEGTRMTIANHSDRTLTDCRFGPGFSAVSDGNPVSVPALAPGASVRAERVSDAAGPAFTCTLPGLPVSLIERRRPIETTGVTLVAVYHPLVDAGNGRPGYRTDAGTRSPYGSPFFVPQPGLRAVRAGAVRGE